MVKKKLKSHEQLGVQIKEAEESLAEFVAEKHRILDLKIKQWTNERYAEDKFKYEIVVETARFIEKLKIVETNGICARVKREYKGKIAPRTVQYACSDENRKWLKPYTYTKSASSKHEIPKIADLTQQEKEYIEAYDNEVTNSKLVTELVFKLTGKDIHAQSDIIGSTPKGGDWRKLLLEKSHQHMFTTAKQMISADIARTLADHRTLRAVSEAFSDILYEEQEVRNKNKEIGSI